MKELGGPIARDAILETHRRRVDAVAAGGWWFKIAGFGSGPPAGSGAQRSPLRIRSCLSGSIERALPQIRLHDARGMRRRVRRPSAEMQSLGAWPLERSPWRNPAHTGEHLARGPGEVGRAHTIQRMNEERLPTVAALGGLGLAAVALLFAAATDGPYLSVDSVNSWIIVFAAGLFAALFAVPFAFERRLRAIGPRWRRPLGAGAVGVGRGRDRRALRRRHARARQRLLGLLAGRRTGPS